jgi:hypothetical protein
MWGVEIEVGIRNGTSKFNFLLHSCSNRFKVVRSTMDVPARLAHPVLAQALVQASEAEAEVGRVFS